jgi:hypothetical protein
MNMPLLEETYQCVLSIGEKSLKLVSEAIDLVSKKLCVNFFSFL